MILDDRYKFIEWIIENRYQYDYTANNQGIVLKDNKIIYVFTRNESNGEYQIDDYWNK